MNFTKAYIKECDCKEIQGLRKELRILDWVDSDEWKLCFVFFYHINPHGYQLYQYWGERIYPLSKAQQREELVWLPAGDNLDNEIVKICKSKKWNYEFAFTQLDYPYYAEVIDNEAKDDDGNYWIHYSRNSDNPLIAKIKLLKALLEEK